MTYIYIQNIDAVHKWQKYTIFNFIPSFLPLWKFTSYPHIHIADDYLHIRNRVQYMNGTLSTDLSVNGCLCL